MLRMAALNTYLITDASLCNLKGEYKKYLKSEENSELIEFPGLYYLNTDYAA